MGVSLPRHVHAAQWRGEFLGSLGAAEATVIRKATQQVIKAHCYHPEMCSQHNYKSALSQPFLRVHQWNRNDLFIIFKLESQV